MFIGKKKFASKLINDKKIIPKRPYSEKLLSKSVDFSLNRFNKKLPYAISVNETIAQLKNIFIMILRPCLYL